ncbi:nitronate monooxygenase [Staphylococcus massiliensis]|uniref:NAD(P)H-dependent flavin oxidoreductase n=1 Tax=Staphylococcus massiliensis TaxID=555791 RepID=UPI001EDCA67B|nr:nitronate monooxygenase [Staphylococcus massiliensis]MCG3401677.1 nitronate monooxygenase [Staphylococcus massiliensis]
MWHNNRVTERLKIDYPIFQAGMTGSTTPELVAAVSTAGGLGQIGAGYMDGDKTRQAITDVQRLTDKPFAVNLFIPEYPEATEDEITSMSRKLNPYREQVGLETFDDVPELSFDTTKHFDEQIDILIDMNVPICSFTFGVPSDATISKLKQAHITLIGTATTVKEAIVLDEKGVDIIIAQGSEAGGHRGTFLGKAHEGLIGTMSLVPQVVDNVSVPVIAAGGIMDSRGIVASLSLGAEGVQLGTAFLTLNESGAKDVHKSAILKATEDETTVTNVFSGKSARGIRNLFINEMSKADIDILPYPLQNQLTNPIRKAAGAKGNVDILHLWCGQSPRLSQRDSTEHFMEKLIKEVNEKM